LAMVGNRCDNGGRRKDESTEFAFVLPPFQVCRVFGMSAVYVAFSIRGE
jgi:hypothetical protein